GGSRRQWRGRGRPGRGGEEGRRAGGRDLHRPPGFARGGGGGEDPRGDKRDARHAGNVDRSPEPLRQGLFPDRQQVRVLLRRRLAFGARDQDSTGHGSDAGRPSRGRPRRLEEGGRRDPEGRAEEIAMSPPDTMAGLVPQPTEAEFPEFVSIPVRLAQHAKAFPEKRAVVCEGKTRTWAEFDKRVNKVAR